MSGALLSPLSQTRIAAGLLYPLIIYVCFQRSEFHMHGKCSPLSHLHRLNALPLKIKNNIILYITCNTHNYIYNIIIQSKICILYVFHIYVYVLCTICIISMYCYLCYWGQTWGFLAESYFLYVPCFLLCSLSSPPRQTQTAPPQV